MYFASCHLSVASLLAARTHVGCECVGSCARTYSPLRAYSSRLQSDVQRNDVNKITINPPIGFPMFCDRGLSGAPSEVSARVDALLKAFREQGGSETSN